MIRSRIIQVAEKLRKADLVIKNAKVVNVFTCEVLPADIAVVDGIIAGVGSYSGAEEFDACGKYACPGLIDSHIHLESSMIAPCEFASTILPFGTTSLIADPHEIANVCGINGIHYMLKSTEQLPLNVFFMMPSCVPATCFESNGADLRADVMGPLKNSNRVLGLAEVMDYPSVLSEKQEMLDKLELFDGSIVDGHSPGLSGKNLNAYKAAGISTDHECSTPEEAFERLRLGMYVQIREGSAARNLENIVKGLLGSSQYFQRCLFCTDDKHLTDIMAEGHINYNVRKTVKLGVDPIVAIRIATLNAAQCYGLKTLGAIAPGYQADIILFNNLKDFIVDGVFCKGKLAAEKGKCLETAVPVEDRNVLNTVRVSDIDETGLAIRLNGNRACVMQLIPGEILNKKLQAEVKTEGGLFKADNEFSKLAVLERHKATGNVGLGIVKGFNIKNGALAGTVAHDSHNLIVIGDNDSDMLAAIQELKRVNGGYAAVSGGKVLETLELPIAGLMSDKSAGYVDEKLRSMLKILKELGVNPKLDPFMSLSFMALPVIPEIRVTDKGLFDVNEFGFIEI